VVELLGDGGGDPHLLVNGMASDWGESLFIRIDKETGRFLCMWTED
jgi:hypothetical protein